MFPGVPVSCKCLAPRSVECHIRQQDGVRVSKQIRLSSCLPQGLLFLLCCDRLALCEFTLEDSARLGVDPAALDSGSPGLAPLRQAFDNPSADVLARAHEEVMDTCKSSRCRFYGGEHGSKPIKGGLKIKRQRFCVHNLGREHLSSCRGSLYPLPRCRAGRTPDTSSRYRWGPWRP